MGKRHLSFFFFLILSPLSSPSFPFSFCLHFLCFPPPSLFIFSYVKGSVLLTGRLFPLRSGFSSVRDNGGSIAWSPKGLSPKGQGLTAYFPQMHTSVASLPISEDNVKTRFSKWKLKSPHFRATGEALSTWVRSRTQSSGQQRGAAGTCS